MELIIKILVIVILVLLIICSAVLLYAHFAKRMNEFEKENVLLKEKFIALEERFSKMEVANKKRMPYEAMDALLDAMSTVDVMEREEAFKLSLIENLRAHITSSLAVGTKREVR